jgi:hypothetical protein
MALFTLPRMRSFQRVKKFVSFVVKASVIARKRQNQSPEDG